MLSDGVITLRAWQPADKPALLDALDDPEILYWFDYLPQPLTDEDADRLIAQAATDWASASRLIFAVCDSATGTPVGCCTVAADGDDTADVSYWTHRDWRGRGIAQRSLRLAADWLYSSPGWERMQLRIDQRNSASRRVAERAGFALEGYALTGRTNERDFSSVYHAVYRMTRDEFAANKQAWSERLLSVAEAVVLAFTASPFAHMGHGAMTPAVHHALLHARTVRSSTLLPSLSGIQQLQSLFLPRSLRAVLTV